jgi:hypothetical protein
MEGKPGSPERPIASRVLAETRKASRQALGLLAPGRRMEAAFMLSMEARKFRIAGLRAQGFPENEIRAIESSRQR